MIRVVHYGSGSWFFYPSRIQAPDPGSATLPRSGIVISDPDQWFGSSIEFGIVSILNPKHRLIKLTIKNPFILNFEDFPPLEFFLFSFLSAVICINVALLVRSCALFGTIFLNCRKFSTRTRALTHFSPRTGRSNFWILSGIHAKCLFHSWLILFKLGNSRRRLLRRC